MSRMYKHIPIAVCISALIILILDNQTAINSASEGISICLQTIIPSLLPTMVLCGIFRQIARNESGKWIERLCSILGYPENGGVFLISSIFGGYPVGAVTVAEAHEQQQLDQKVAQKMLAYCNNAGPAFIFGICATQFSAMHYTYATWIIHILSGIFVGKLMNRNQIFTAPLRNSDSKSIVTIVESSAKSMAYVCIWIILFRVVINFMNDCLLWILPSWLQIPFVGIIELSNGAIQLHEIKDEHIRFLVCQFILSFGGFCVYLQTASVAKKISTRLYIPIKGLQGIISIFLGEIYYQIAINGVYWYALCIPFVIFIINFKKYNKLYWKIQKYRV